MPLADYLAKNYLSADAPTKKSSKKRKRQHDPSINGLTIADDDDNSASHRHHLPGAGDSDSDSGPTIFGTVPNTSNSSKAKKHQWIKIGAAAPSDAEQLAADAVLASAVAEAEARKAEAEGDGDREGAPMVVETDTSLPETGKKSKTSTGPTMSSGAAAGLQTAAEVAASLEIHERNQREAMRAANSDAATAGLAHETIYRDASGRIINVAMKRAELRAQAAEDERKEREERISRRGDVQRREAEARREELKDASTLRVARYADDEKLNAELRDRERWNDSMAAMLGSSGKEKSGRKGKASGKTYQGAAEPNRYGIRPGWRWDGVDRGNGFERKWFAARNKARDRRELEYAWQMDE